MWLWKSDKSSVDQNGSYVLHFEKIPEVDLEISQWTETNIRDTTDLIYQNIQRLESYLSFIVSRLLDS